MSTQQPSASAKSVVIRISPIAHFAVLFFLVCLTAVLLAATWTVPLLLIPVALSLAIVRLRTVADRDTVTARGLLRSDTVSWEDIEGLRFNKGSWARAQLKNGRQLVLPAVTFATLPQLTEVSAGRVPNPYD